MQPRPEHKTDFPLYEGKKEFHALSYNYYYPRSWEDPTPPRLLNPDGVPNWHRSCPKTFVKVHNPDYGRYSWEKKPFKYGYVLVADNGVPRHVQYNWDKLERQNHQFRQSPVWYTGKYKNHISARKISGKKGEKASNDYCDQEFPEYQLVRQKRKEVIDKYLSWSYDELDGYHNYNSQRGWKRSKKRKQWM